MTCFNSGSSHQSLVDPSSYHKKIGFGSKEWDGSGKVLHLAFLWSVRTLFLREQLRVVIEKEIKNHRATMDPNDPRDFIDEMLIEEKKSGTDELYTGIALYINV